ncbi:hypothetical protein CB1_000390005 [Camelus ferus]|nr:hypothetical protein CB1_000390005 [Camelus ferus]
MYDTQSVPQASRVQTLVLGSPQTLLMTQEFILCPALAFAQGLQFGAESCQYVSSARQHLVILLLGFDWVSMKPKPLELKAASYATFGEFTEEL